MTKVVLIHTVDGNIKVFDDLVQEIAPGLPAEHVVDESLLGDTIAAGVLTDEVRQRFREPAGTAQTSSCSPAPRSGRLPTGSATSSA